MTADVMRADLIARAQKVRLVAFDVDGIMTDDVQYRRQGDVNVLNLLVRKAGA